jgi:hypothetical protein
MLLPIGLAVLFFVIFIVSYKYLRGYYPGSTLMKIDPARDPSAPRLIFFYTTWCPHSRKALGEWNSLKTLIREQKTKFGDKTVEFEAIDGESSKTAVARYGIDAYPSLVIDTSTDIIHYDGHFKVASIMDWLVQTLGQEGS